MVYFEFHDPLQYPDPINTKGKDKIKQYFQVKLTDMAKFILEHPEFPYSYIDKDSMRCALCNARPSPGHPAGDVDGINGLAVFYDKDLDKYCITAGLQLSFDYDYAVRTYHIIMQDFENAERTAPDKIFPGKAATGEYLRNTGLGTRIKFITYVQVILDPEDIK